MISHGYVPNQFGRGIIIPLVKDKHGDVSNSSNYRGITISPVVSKIFECCLLLKFDSYLVSDDLQFGFKKDIGCGPALFTFQQVVKYFTSRGSTVFVTAVDASKAFDRLDHSVLVRKLVSRKVPACFTRIISCWYSKLYSSVRWHSVLSAEFRVLCGVRQGGILSPILFNLYVDELIKKLRGIGDGCYVSSCFVGCIMYADDLLLVSPTIAGLQRMLNVCSDFGASCNIMFNPAKTISVAIGNRHCCSVAPVYIDSQPIVWVDQLKYLGVVFNTHGAMNVDVMPVKRRFYAALNSILVGCHVAEPVKVQLVRSFCTPLLTYCIGALELRNSAVNDLGVCWNDAFRKIFHYNRWESVKQLQFFSGCMDLRHMYDLARCKFLTVIATKLPYLSHFCSCLELQYCTVRRLCQFYVGASAADGASTQSFVHAVHRHFEICAMDGSAP